VTEENEHPYARKVLLTIILIQLIMMVTAGALRGRYITSYDGIGYFVWLRSPLMDGDFDFSNDFKLYNPDGKAPAPDVPYDKTGKTQNQYSAGMPFMCAPGYLVGFLGDVLTSDLATDGFGDFAQLGYVLNSFLYYAMGLFLLFKFLSSIVDQRMALWLCVFVAFGSTAGYYAWNEPFFAHAVEFFFCVLILIWLTDPRRLDTKQALQGGVLFGLAVWCRADMLIFLLPALGRLFKSKEMLKSGAIALSVMVLILLPHYFLRYHITGEFALAGGYDNPIVGGSGFVNLASPHLDLTMLSSNNGYLFWCPLYLLGFWGLWVLFRSNKTLFAMVVLIKIYLMASWGAWDGSSSMGPRLLNALIPVMCWGMGLLLTRKPGLQKWLPAMVLLSCLWFTGLVFQRMAGQLPYEEGRVEVIRDNKKVIESEPLANTPYKRVILYQFANLKYLLSPGEALKLIREN
jgi:hypothetical protein